MQRFLASQLQSVPSSSDRAWVEIDLEALAYNVRQLRQVLAPTSRLMGIVKADAYGHGATEVARTLLSEGISDLGVASISEGISLRRAGIKVPILVLGVAYVPSQIWAIADWKLQPTLCSPKQALIFSSTLAAAKFRGEIPVHLNLDTGMSRLGTSWQQAEDFVQLVNSLPHLKLSGVYSHFATADEADTEEMYAQAFRFQQARQKILNLSLTTPIQFHLANSAAMLRDTNLHYDMVRVGLALYGLYPHPHLREKINLKPVLQVKAKITQIKTILPGTAVSYGRKFIAKKETRVAVVSIGYADGVSRRLSNQMSALIQGKRVAQIGSITMDQLMLDVSMIPDLQEGETVTLIGRSEEQSISVEQWSEILGTISWEILCGFKQRLPRISLSIKKRNKGILDKLMRLQKPTDVRRKDVLSR